MSVLRTNRFQRFLGSFLQDDGKDRPLPRFALTEYLPVKLLANTLCNGETETCRWLTISGLGGDFAILGKKMRQFVLFDTNPLIPHLDADGVLLLADADPDILSMIGVFDGIRQQVLHHTGQ